VLATLHTNDASSAVTRLTDMGVEPFLLSSSLLGVLAQRLVRKVCPVCSAPTLPAARGSLPPEGAAPPWGGPAAERHGKGCESCSQTGYQGRTGVFELLVTNDAIRAQIHNRASEADIRAAALASGMTLMRDDGERLIASGVTTREEVLRVTRD
jgi:general secretion pathway protein E